MKALAFALLLTACGGSVDSAEPPPCESYLHTVRYSSPVLDPGGTADTLSVECMTPAGSHDGVSRIWCCL